MAQVKDNPYKVTAITRDEFLTALETGTAGTTNEIRNLPNGTYLGEITGWGVRESDKKVRVKLMLEYDGKTVNVVVGVAADAKTDVAAKDKGERIGFSVQKADGLTDDNGNAVRFGQINAAAILKMQPHPAAPATTPP